MNEYADIVLIGGANDGHRLSLEANRRSVVMPIPKRPEVSAGITGPGFAPLETEEYVAHDLHGEYARHTIWVLHRMSIDDALKALILGYRAQL